MLDEKMISMLEATSEILNLEVNVIEKDYYVTQVIHALSTVKNSYFQLIFSGGTCLSKAHKLKAFQVSLSCAQIFDTQFSSRRLHHFDVLEGPINTESSINIF